MRSLIARPGLAILVVAPFFGEGLSGATGPIGLLVPGHLALMIALYGCGALLCRELAYRFRLGNVGLMLLGAAFGVFEEGLVDRYWFLPTYWADSGVGDYAVVGPVNVLLAVHLTVFHAVVSVTSAVLVTEQFFPAWQRRPWAPRGVLVVATIVLLLGMPFVYGEFDRGPGVVGLLPVAGICLLLIAAAFAVPALRRHWAPPSHRAGPGASRRRPVVVVAAAAFLGIGGHFVLTYTVPNTALPWPAGGALSLAPVLVAGALIARWAGRDNSGRDVAWALAGVLMFFVLLDLLLVLLGRYDMVVAPLITVPLVIAMLRRAGHHSR